MANRSELPIAIRRKAGGDAYSWEFVRDYVGGIHSVRHRYGDEPKYEVRMIRVDEPKDMVAGESVPFEERDRLLEEAEQRERERRKRVEALADEIIRKGASHLRSDLGNDFDLEREVLDELWSRWREVAGDRFLLKSVER